MKFVGTTCVTRQGQVTLPKIAREEGNYALGSVLEVYFSNDLILMKRKREPVKAFEELASKTRAKFRERKITKKDVEEEIRLSRK